MQADARAMTPAFVEVLDAQRECHDVVSITFEAPERPPAPGQFNMLYAWGAGESAISASSITAETGRVVHTIRAVGNVTEALCRLRPGDPVGVRGPFGNAWPLPDCRGKDVLIVAGGIGLAPLRPVVESIFQDRDAFGNVSVLYGARRPDDLIYEADRNRWNTLLDVAVIVDFAEAPWRGSTGVVTKLLPGARFDPKHAVALLCGPEVMMRSVARELAQRGMTPNHIHVSLERNMKCAVAVCGHCQLGTELICRDGPVYAYDRVATLLHVREL